MPSAPCTTVTRRSAKAWRCRCSNAKRFQLHDESQQPHLKLFRRPGLRGGDGLLVEGGQGGGLGDPPGDPIDDPDLLGVQLAAPKRLPHGRHTSGESAAAGDQAAHLIRLVAQ